MKSKQLYYFAESDDTKSLLQPIEESELFKYYSSGLFDDQNSLHVNSLLNLSDLGRVYNGDWNQSKCFLVVPKESFLNIRSIQQKDGCVKYAVDQLRNPKSIVFKVSGILREGVMVAGSIGTVSDDPFSIDTYNKFFNNIRKIFSKVGNFYLGPKAATRLEQGWRLVTNVNSPTQYDLQRD